MERSKIEDKNLVVLINQEFDKIDQQLYKLSQSVDKLIESELQVCIPDPPIKISLKELLL